MAWYGMVVWRHLARINLEEKEEKSLSPHVALLFAVDAKSENSFFSFHFPYRKSSMYAWYGMFICVAH